MLQCPKINVLSAYYKFVNVADLAAGSPSILSVTFIRVNNKLSLPPPKQRVGKIKDLLLRDPFCK